MERASASVTRMSAPVALRPMASARSAAEAAYPSLRAAAKMLAISPSTLSRRPDLRFEKAGQERRVPAAEVVRLAADYKKRDLSRVAAMLYEHAYDHPTNVRDAIAIEVQAALRAYEADIDGTDDARRFLKDARRYLPPALADQVEASMAREAVDESAGLVGWAPDED